MRLDSKEQEELVSRVRAERDKVALAADAIDEGTYLTWLWVGLFGIFYFAWHGFWWRGILSILLGAVLVTFLGPFGFICYYFAAVILAYKGWEARARKEVEATLSRPRF